jgi:hypothetical protein
MDATLIVTSDHLHLSDIEKVLGESRLQGHDLGGMRKNGSQFKQSIWMRNWTVHAEPPFSPLSIVLDWYAPLHSPLHALDSSLTVKLAVKIAVDDVFAAPVELSSQLSQLGVFMTVSFQVHTA